MKIEADAPKERSNLEPYPINEETNQVQNVKIVDQYIKEF